MTDLPDAAHDAPIETGDLEIVVETDDAGDVHAASAALGVATTDELLEDLFDERPVDSDTAREIMKGSSFLARRVERLTSAALAARQRENSLLVDNAKKDQRIADLEARVADLEARNAELDELAMTDLLTGLPNRRAIEAHTDRLLGRRGKATGLIVFDLNGFKYVNDTYGHSAGDTTLRTVAEAMTRVLRKSDVGARLGGDEFAVAVDLNGQMDPEDQDETMRKVAFRVADAVRTRLDSLVNSDDFDRESDLYRQITASFGFAVSDGTETREGLGERADRAMYKAKTNGGHVRIVNARELS
jgi:diguanylate cyclase (GGDEF)-like protein